MSEDGGGGGGDFEGGDFSEVTTENFMGRMGNSCCGVGVGIILFLLAGPLIWWNEGRAVFTRDAINAGMANVVEADCSRLDPANEGKLIHFACELEGLSSFSALGGVVSVNESIFLATEVSMYQWTETSRKQTSNTAAGGKKTSARGARGRGRAGGRAGVAGAAHSREERAIACAPALTRALHARALSCGANPNPNPLTLTLTSPRLAARAPRAAATTYSYSRAWTGSPINSNAFKRPTSNRTNPPDSAWPLHTNTQWAAELRAGVYSLPTDKVKSALSSSEPLELSGSFARGGNVSFSAVQPPAAITPATVALFDSHTLSTADPAKPTPVGAMHISFERSTATAASALAAQQGDGIAEWGSGTKKVKDGYELFRLVEGEQSAQDMFEEMHASNNAMTWVLRLVCLLCAWGGLYLVVAPLATMPDFIPFCGEFIGDMIGMVLGCAMGCIALVYCCTIGAIAWIRFRPLLGVGLLLVAAAAGGAYWYARQYASKKKKEESGGGELLS